jgi:hypothetical protein
MKTLLKLNNGEQVSVDEFITWHPAKQWRLTVPIEEYKANIERTKAANSHAVITPLGKFSSMRAACKALGISSPTLRGYIHNSAYPDYRFADEKNLIEKSVLNKIYITGKKRTVTPLGIFSSKIEAAVAHGLTKGQFERVMKKNPKEFFYLASNTNKRPIR